MGYKRKISHKNNITQLDDFPSDIIEVAHTYVYACLPILTIHLEANVTGESFSGKIE